MCPVMTIVIVHGRALPYCKLCNSYVEAWKPGGRLLGKLLDKVTRWATTKLFEFN